MGEGGSPGPAAAAGVTILVLDPRWRRLVAAPERLVRRAAATLPRGEDGVTIVLASDRMVRRLNARHRGRDKPTNVLTFPPAGAGLPGEIVLARGMVEREARAAGRPASCHLAHLAIHGLLHLAGHDHHQPGEARRMEMAEARALARLGIANPWRVA